MGYDELITTVRRLCRDAIDARFAATAQQDRVRTQAYLDGYLRALSDTRRVDDAELLRLVGEERRRHAEAEQV